MAGSVFYEIAYKIASYSLSGTNQAICTTVKEVECLFSIIEHTIHSLKNKTTKGITV